MFRFPPQIHPRRLLRIIRTVAPVRLVEGPPPASSDALRSTDTLRGAKLRVDLGRARLQLALLEERLDQQVERDSNASSEGERPSSRTRDVLDFTRQLLEASVTARVAEHDDPVVGLERWLTALVRESKVAFPDARIQGVGVAAQRNGTYEYAAGAEVPRELEGLLPAPAARDFGDCLRTHVPTAWCYGFNVGDVPHWFVVLSSRELDPDEAAPAFKLVAIEVARAMRLAA